MNVLVTGGAGYIGSHTCVELLNEGHNVIVVDNLVNSKLEAIKRVQKITNKDVVFHKIDLFNYSKLSLVFKEQKIDAVIHFAGLKAVGESVKNPLLYYQNNLSSTLTLLKVIGENNVKTLVFSSSATVYGDPKTVPITEDFPLSATNPYGRTKFMIEEILRDLYASDNSWNITILRYFNPIGAHESGLIGEDPNGIPNNLMPFISQVAIGKLPKLTIFGNDYKTVDGTCIRDYIHVVDLSLGHIKALEAHLNEKGIQHTYNLGTGHGVTVLQLVDAFQKVTGKKIPYEVGKRRLGDIPACFADATKAEKELGWKATKTIEDMCRDSWNWQNKNPNGYTVENE